MGYSIPGPSCLKWKELSDCSFLAPWYVVRNREVTDIEASVSLRWKQASQLHTACMWIGRVWFFVTPWTIQSVEFSRPEYWSSHSLLQGIFPTQGSNPGLLHCRQILYQLSHKGKYSFYLLIFGHTGSLLVLPKLSLVAVSRHCSSLWCEGFSLRWFLCCRAWALGTWASVAAACRLSSCGTWA